MTWIIIGLVVIIVGVGGFLAARVLLPRAFETSVRRLFETGRHDLAVERLRARGRLPEAAEQLQRWGQVDAAAKVHVELGQWSAAADLYERKREYGTAAVYFLKAGDREKAAHCYARHGRTDRAAELYKELGRSDKAVDLLREAGDLDGAAAVLIEASGEHAAVEMLVASGKVQEAATLLRDRGDDRAARELLVEHYDRTQDWGAAGAELEALGRLEDALERYRKAGLALEAGTLYERLERFEDAARQLERAKSFDRAASCWERVGQFREAARLYLLAGLMKQAVENLVRGGDVVSVGQIYHQSGFHQQALDVLGVEPGHTQYKEARVLRARLLENGGDVEGARNELIQVVTRLGLSQQTVDVVFLIAEIYAQQGDAANALRILERTKARGLQHDLLDQRIERLRGVINRQQEVAATAGPAAAAPGVEINLAAALPQTDRYEFQKKLGQGGMGAVYRAFDKQLQKIVAIKLLLDSDLPSDMAKKYFFREAQTVSILSHPNIVGLYDFGEMDGRPFISMEFIEGRNLEQIAKKSPILPLRLMLPICVQLSDALDYAHAKKVIHRDIKLGNVMVTPDEHVKLMDFGLAKAITENPDRSLLVIGTPYYMAPEQIAHEDIDHRVDIYALGILMYRLATGHLPFESGDVLRAQRFEAPPDPLAYNPELPKQLVGVILHCLEKRPEDRPQRAAEIVERLVTVLS
jgi:tetratricopeptide (TPR) repeat protein